jgi:hypothetical protein
VHLKFHQAQQVIGQLLEVVDKELAVADNKMLRLAEINLVDRQIR